MESFKITLTLTLTAATQEEAEALAEQFCLDVPKDGLPNFSSVTVEQP